MITRSTWYVRHPEDGLFEFDSEEEARNAAVRALQYYVDGDPEADSLEWGVLAPRERVHIQPDTGGQSFTASLRKVKVYRGRQDH